MGFRFRRSNGLGKFFRVNVSPSGLGLSAGVRGLRAGVGPRGAHMSAGIPGTGVSWTNSGGATSQRKSGCLVGCGALVVFYVLIVAFVKAGASFGTTVVTMTVVTVLALIAAGIFSSVRANARRRVAQAADEYAVQQRAEAEQHRWNGLVARFGHETATKIWEGKIWVGQTLEMLIESLGPPLERDSKMTRGTSLQTYKYRPLPGNNRWGLRVELEDGVVSGWDAKDV